MANDLRSAIQSSMGAGGASASPAAAAPTPASPAPSASGATVAPTTPASPVRDSGGRFQGKGEAASEVVASGGPTAAPQGAAAEAGTSPASAAKPTAPSYKPPQSWGVKVREKWGALDPEIQAEIDKRERDVSNKIRSYGELNKFRESLTPYAGLLGEDPTKGIASILQREATWNTATPQQRVAIIADQIVKGQLPIDALDQALAGRVGGQVAPQQAQAIDPEALIRQAEERVAQRIQSSMAARETQRAQASIAEFAAKHEFFSAPGVQDKMAGLIEAGVAKGMDDAYALVCKIDPEISGVISQRSAAEAARETTADTAAAKAAAMSVRSSPVATAAPTATDLRSQIVANMAASRR